VTKISEITIGKRRRKLNESKVQELAESMAVFGLLNPVTISTGNELIAGYHRIEAAKRLGWNEIATHTLPGDPLQHELAEIDENLIRNDLTALERGEHLARRKEIYEGMHPETKREATLKQNRSEIISERELLSFAESTAAAVGVSSRTIRQEVQIAESITEPVKELIRETPVANRKTDLIELAREKDPDEQARAASIAVQREEFARQRRRQQRMAKKAAKRVTGVNPDQESALPKAQRDRVSKLPVKSERPSVGTFLNDIIHRVEEQAKERIASAHIRALHEIIGEEFTAGRITLNKEAKPQLAIPLENFDVLAIQQVVQELLPDINKLVGVPIENDVIRALSTVLQKSLKEGTIVMLQR